MRRRITPMILLLIFFLALSTLFLFLGNLTLLADAQEDTEDPIAVINPFPDTKIGDTVEFNGSGSYDPGRIDETDNGIIEWDWFIRDPGEDWTDQDQIGNERVFEQIFEKPGEYIINLTVTDSYGLTGSIEKFLVVTGPDLQVLNIEFRDPSISNLESGDYPTITVTYTNSGTVEIDSSWSILILDNSEWVKEDIISDPLAPGETRHYSFSTYKMRSGERQFNVFLDSDDEINEMLEENNEFRTMVSVSGSDDLIFNSSEETSSTSFVTIGVLIVILILIIIIIVAIPIVIIIIIFFATRKK